MSFITHHREEVEPTAKTRGQKDREILARFEMPAHWRPISPSEPFGSLRQSFFSLLCLTAFGNSSLDLVWAHIKQEEEGDDSGWIEGTRQTVDRINNMLVVGSLLLASSASFIASEPPRASIMNYTLRGPYLCLLGSFGLLLGGIVVASASILITSKATTYWTEHVLLSSRARVYCTLIMLSYSFFSIGTATLLLAFGTLTATWCADDLGAKGAAIILLVLPISMAAVFGISNMIGAARNPNPSPRKDFTDV